MIVSAIIVIALVIAVWAFVEYRSRPPTPPPLDDAVDSR
jgi:hypothetical protein